MEVTFLSKEGRLLLFYFPQEEITAIESATLATFIYTLMDICGRLYRQRGIKFCIIVDDVGIWSHHKRSMQAFEALVQPKGRKMGLFRAFQRIRAIIFRTMSKTAITAPPTKNDVAAATSCSLSPSSTITYTESTAKLIEKKKHRNEIMTEIVSVLKQKLPPRLIRQFPFEYPDAHA